MSRKFERLLDYLVNEDMEKANALFHEIVVEKSRNIYENLMADSMYTEDDLYQEAMGGDPADDFVSDVEDEDMAMDDADMDMDDADMDMDDADMGMDMDDADMDMGMDDDSNDLDDIKDALDELKAEFEELLGKLDDTDEFDDEDEDMDMDMEDEAMDMDDEDMGDEDEDMEDEDEDMEDEDEEMIREYREIVKKNPLDSDKESGAHTHSPVNANPSDRPGGNTVKPHNIAQSTKDSGKVSVATAKGQFVGADTANVNGKGTKGYAHSVKAPPKEGAVNSKPVVPK